MARSERIETGILLPLVATRNHYTFHRVPWCLIARWLLVRRAFLAGLQVGARDRRN